MTIRVRPFRDEDVVEADRIFRTAFGTFLGFPDPLTFGGETDYVRSRWRLAPAGAFAAEQDGVLVGSVFTTCWGSFGFFGPLSVRPDLWNRGVAQALLEPVMARFAAAGVSNAGLFTFAQSAKHVGLYGKFGFHPRFLTIVAAKTVTQPVPEPAWRRIGALSPAARADTLAACRRIADGLHAGLDPTAEIAATVASGLGDTVLIEEDGAVVGFALCHVGPGTEAGRDTCYVKLAAVPSGSVAAPHFDRLLDACEAFAIANGANTLTAGINLARDQAADQFRRRGFRTIIQGVAMHRPNVPGYCRAEVYALDDWR